MPGATQQMRCQRRVASGSMALVIACLAVVSLWGACTQSPEGMPPNTALASIPAPTTVPSPPGAAAGSRVGEQARTPTADATSRDTRQPPTKRPQVPSLTPAPQSPGTAAPQPPVVPTRVSASVGAPGPEPTAKPQTTATSVPRPTATPEVSRTPMPTAFLVPTEEPASAAASLPTPTPTQEALTPITQLEQEATTRTAIEEILDACNLSFGPFFENRQTDFLQWSPDGSFLIFDFDEADWYAEAIWLVNAEGTNLRKVADSNPPAERGHDTGTGKDAHDGFHAHLSPNGNTLVYSTCEYVGPNHEVNGAGFVYEIATIGIDGTGRRRLTQDRTYQNFPAWSPDGTRIAYVDLYDKWRETQAYLPWISTISIAGADNDAFVPKQEADVLKGVALYAPAWSPDGQYLALVLYDIDRRRGLLRPQRLLYILEANEAPIAAGTEIGMTSTPATWSPDSTRLAYARSEGERTSIYTVGPDGSGLREIWRGLEPVYRLSWHPDGSEILVVSKWLWAISPDGDKTRVIGSHYPPVSLGTAAWSPDGSRIAARGPWLGDREVHSFDFDGFKVITMTREGGDVRVLVTGDSSREEGVRLWGQPNTGIPPDTGACSEESTVPGTWANPGLVRDCETLLAIRDQLSGNSSLNWNGLLSIHEWEGIEIEERADGQRVTVLQLDLKGLSGGIPPEMGLLTALRALSLNANELTGGIPIEIGSLTDLQYLRVKSNLLSGPFPKGIWELGALRKVDVSRTFISGCVPQEVSRYVGNGEKIDLGAADSSEPPLEVIGLEPCKPSEK